MPAFFRTVSGIVLLAIIAVFALQAFPFTGLFVMMLGGLALAGLLIQVFLISLLVEACLGRVPRALAAIPIIAYGGYYALYAYQTVDIQLKTAQLQQRNPGKIFDFDPEVHSLVTPDARLVTQYAVPVAYQPDKNFKPEDHLAFRLVRNDQCNNLAKDGRHRAQKFGVHFGDVFQNNVCDLRFPESPARKVVMAVKRGDTEAWNGTLKISERLTEIIIDGAVVGSFRTASVWRLPIFPRLTIGCGLRNFSDWKCDADFLLSHIKIDTIPHSVDHGKYGSPESVMLGIPKYSAADLTNFRGFKQNDEALRRIAE